MLRFSLNVLMFSVPAIFAGLWALRLSRTSRDEWKMLVWLPVVPPGWWALVIARDTTRDPTSHNLWPLELIAVVALSLVLFAVVLLIRRLAGTAHTLPIDRQRDGTA